MPPAIEDVIAERIRYFRQARGLSVRQLAARCADRGVSSLTEASLGNIERKGGKRGRRDVSISEMLLLASVLDVPPLALLAPPDGSVVVMPEVELTPEQMVGWFTDVDYGPIVFDPGREGNDEDEVRFHAVARLRDLVRHNHYLLQYLADDETFREQSWAMLSGVRDRIRARGGRLPDLMVDELREREERELKEAEAGSVHPNVARKRQILMGMRPVGPYMEGVRRQQADEDQAAGEADNG